MAPSRPLEKSHLGTGIQPLARQAALRVTSVDICTCDPKVWDPSQRPRSLGGGLLPTLERCKDCRPAPGSGLRQGGPPSVGGAVPATHPDGSRGWILPGPAAAWKPTAGAGAPRPPAQRPLLSTLQPGPHRRPGTRAGRGAKFLGERGRGGLAGKISLPHLRPTPQAVQRPRPLAPQKWRPHLNSKPILRCRANAPSTGPGEM